MPSRQLLSTTAAPPSNPHLHRHQKNHLLIPILAGSLSFIILSFSIFLVFFFYRKLSKNRTAPTDLKSPSTHHHNNHPNHQCRRFSYSMLRRATYSFSSSNRLGHGGFGSVYKAILSSSTNQLVSVAVKLMDPNGSLQGEREFYNELTVASSLSSPYIVSLLGFSSDRRKKKLLLVYELMENRSLQESLLDGKCEELMNWRKRYDLICDVAKGLEYLHNFCNPPVIHGDIKPSNILLDKDFNAKIGDFGLARLMADDSRKEGVGVVEDNSNGLILEEETQSVVTAYDQDSGLVADIGRSPESIAMRVLDSVASPEMGGSAALSPEVELDKGSVLSEVGFDDKVSVDSGIGEKRGAARRDWWWKQDSNEVGGGSESGRVKDYVMEWIGSEIKKERPKSEWIASPSSVEKNDALSTKSMKIEKPKKHEKKLEWWASLDEDRLRKKEKSRKPREWWKEEFCEELTKKKKMKKKKRGSCSSNCGDSYDDLVDERKRGSKRSRGSSIDWWLDGFSGEFRNGRRKSQDWASGEIPKSGGISSTPSMRGTVCYIAPECGGGGQISEKCDVYSFGVLVLVVISGRRPLQVTASPISEFERANLISWARQLAYRGKLLDLVDPLVHSLDKDQAFLCITIALLCLQRSPSKRPSMKQIMEMLSGEAEPPHLPFEFSPSPPSNFPFKSWKKAR